VDPEHGLMVENGVHTVGAELGGIFFEWRTKFDGFEGTF
jgi:hypothetical protein